MGETTIEWATKTLNFFSWNCTRVSSGCANCYAAEMSKRFSRNSNGGIFSNPPTWRTNAVKEYRKLKSGDVIFLNSMSDSYHESVPVKWIHNIHNMAMLRPDVTFLLLTKRPERALALSPYLAWSKNLWIGTSVESEDYLWRLDYLLKIPAAGHFLSAEPLLSSLPSLKEYLYPTSDRAGLGWVIVGGESGTKRRAFNKAWASDIQAMCATSETPFMFKQGSDRLSGKDRLLNGREWNETPFMSNISNIQKTQPDNSLYDLPLFQALGIGD